jgi:hypothetical protein
MAATGGEDSPFSPVVRLGDSIIFDTNGDHKAIVTLEEKT